MVGAAVGLQAPAVGAAAQGAVISARNCLEKFSFDVNRTDYSF